MDAKKLTILSLVILVLVDHAQAGSGIRRLHYLRKGQYAAAQAAAAKAAADAAMASYLAGNNIVLGASTIDMGVVDNLSSSLTKTGTSSGSLMIASSLLPSDIAAYLTMVSTPATATSTSQGVSPTQTVASGTASNSTSTTVVVPDNGTLTVSGATDSGSPIYALISPGTTSSSTMVTSSINLSIGGTASPSLTTATGTLDFVKSGAGTVSLTGSSFASFTGNIVVNGGTLVITDPSTLQSYVGRLIVGTGAKVIIGSGPGEVTIGPGTWDLSQFYSSGIITPVTTN